MKTLLEKMHFRNKIKKAVLEFKRSELTGEIFTKLTVQTLLLLLSYTSTPTTSGLETVFDEDLQSSLINNQVLLAFSLIFSFKTTLSTFVDIKGVEKEGFLPFKSKYILALCIILLTVGRIGRFVIHFAPFMSHFNLLAHWKAEQMDFEMKKGQTICRCC